MRVCERSTLLPNNIGDGRGDDHDDDCIVIFELEWTADAVASTEGERRAAEDRGVGLRHARPSRAREAQPQREKKKSRQDENADDWQLGETARHREQHQLGAEGEGMQISVRTARPRWRAAARSAGPTPPPACLVRLRRRGAPGCGPYSPDAGGFWRLRPVLPAGGRGANLFGKLTGLRVWWRRASGTLCRTSARPISPGCLAPLVQRPCLRPAPWVAWRCELLLQLMMTTPPTMGPSAFAVDSAFGAATCLACVGIVRHVVSMGYDDVSCVVLHIAPGAERQYDASSVQTLCRRLMPKAFGISSAPSYMCRAERCSLAVHGMQVWHA